jgi:hypothetical protein
LEGLGLTGDLIVHVSGDVELGRGMERGCEYRIKQMEKHEEKGTPT